MTTETAITTISDKFSAVWALVQPLPEEQRIQAQDAIIRAYEHVTDNIQALLTLTDEISAQRDNAIEEIAYIQKHRGHISYDDVARDMSREIEDITYEDARNIVDVLTGMSEANISSWDVMDVREAMRNLADHINETLELEALEAELELAEQNDI